MLKQTSGKDVPGGNSQRVLLSKGLHLVADLVHIHRLGASTVAQLLQYRAQYRSDNAYLLFIVRNFLWYEPQTDKIAYSSLEADV